MRLLLVNDSVAGYETFVSSSNENTEVILFNKSENTYASILAKKKLDSYESVGIVDYNYNYILAKELDIFTPEGKDSLVQFLKGFNTPIVDFMACYLFKEDMWRAVFDSIEAEGINTRSSIDETGNLFAGGNWVMESEEEPVNVKDLYFTELISEYAGLLDVQQNINYFGDRNTNTETDDYIICRFFTGHALLYKKFKKVWITMYGANQNNYNGFWLIDQNGDVIDNITDIIGNLDAIIIKTTIYSYIFYYERNSYATIINVGPTGGPLTNIVDIQYNANAFSIYDGSNIYGIGNSSTGGINFNYATPIRLQNGTTGPFLTDVDKIYSVRNTFAVKGASGVYVWGATASGGINIGFATQLRLQNGTTGPFLTDVQEIYTASSGADGAFVARGASGLYTWGTTAIGGINTGFATRLRLENGTTGPFLTDIQEVYPNDRSFSVKGSSGVYVWGSANQGGINTGFATQVRIDNGTTGPFLTNVEYIAPNLDAYVAKGPSGFYIWGRSFSGAPATNFASLVKSGPGGSTGPVLEGITDIYPNEFGFLFKGNSGAYITGDLNGSIWPTTYAQQVLTGGSTGDAIVPIDNVSSSNQLYSIDSNNTVYDILSNTLVPTTYTPYKSVSGRGNILIYNDTELFSNTVLNAPITSLYKSISVPTTGITPLLNGFAMAFIRNGNVFINGSGSNGGRNALMSLKQYEFGLTGPFLTNISNIYSTKYLVNDTTGAFAAKGSSGIYAWGNDSNGGIAASFATQLRLQNGTTGPFLTDIQEVYSNNNAFAVKGASGVYAWGNVAQGGIATGFATRLRLQNGTTGPFLTDVNTIYNNTLSFTVRGSSGLYAWGFLDAGGINSAFATQIRLDNGTTGPFLTDMQEVYPNNYAYAIKGVSGVYCWGDTFSGGLANTFARQLRLQNGTTGPFLTDVEYIVPINNSFDTAVLTSSAFVAKGASGVYAWGNSSIGGINPSFATQVRLQNGTTGPFLTDIQDIYTNIQSCAVKGVSGIYAWGNNTGGGIASASFATQIRLQNGTTGPLLTDVIDIVSNNTAYAARGASGVYCWGSASSGGLSAGFATQLRLQNGTTGPFLTDAIDVVSNNLAFAVRGASGVYAWGSSSAGGLNTGFATQIRINDATAGPFLTNVEELYGSNNFFVAKTPQNFYIWGGMFGASQTFASAINITDAEAILKPNNLLNTTIDLTNKTTTVEELLIKSNNNAEGIAITKATNWRYKPSSSPDWKDIENVSDTNGLLLLKSTALEYGSDGKAPVQSTKAPVQSTKAPEPTLEFNAWNGEIGDEEDYFNTNLEYFNIVSDNKASVVVEEKTTPSEDSSALRIIMIALLIIVGIFLLVLVVWYFFGSKSSSRTPSKVGYVRY